MKDTHPFWELWAYAKTEQHRVRVASLYSVINKFFDLFPEIIIGVAIDVIVRGKESFVSNIGIIDPKNQILFLAVITFAIFALESLFQFLFSLKWRQLAQVIQHRLRMDSYNHIQTLDLSYFENNQSGNLMAVLNDDVNQLERFLDTGANSLIQLLTTVLMVGFYFFYIAPYVAIFAMFPIPFILWGGYYFQGKLAPKYKEVRESVGGLNSRLSQNLSGIATIKSYVTEAQEAHSISLQSQAYMESNKSAIYWSSAFVPLIRILIVCGFMGTLILGGFRVIEGDLNAGLFTSLLFLTQRLLWPFTSLATTVDLYQRAMASTGRIMGLLRTDSKIVTVSSPIKMSDFKNKIVFDNVDFSYEGYDSLIKKFDFEILKGQSIGVVGTTGSGKSTLVKLLMRFYDVRSGGIIVDGTNIKEMDLPALRKLIGYVSQDVFLMDGTIRENLCFNQEGLTEDKIIDAAKLAEAHDFISSMPKGYETRVGERGQKLSGGQKQRISIARAILKNPPILILDEATASVDNETEAAIQRSLKHLVKGRTTIIIAHRLSTVVDCDEVLVLDKGMLAESGSHHELIELGKIYHHLWQVQTGVRH